MPAQPRKQYQFTTPTRRAITMSEVSGREKYYGEILVGYRPIIGRGDALEVYEEAMDRAEREDTDISDEDKERIRQRYLNLGREGTNSLVTVTLPGNVCRPDLRQFYSEVDAELAQDQQARGR